jgi:hypothetical protein
MDILHVIKNRFGFLNRQVYNNWKMLNSKFLQLLSYLRW